MDYDNDVDDEILKYFFEESNELIDQLLLILEAIEENPEEGAELKEFAQIVDRIMGGAATAALELPAEHQIHQIAKFAQLCKLIGQKAAQVTGNKAFTSVVVAFLLDATETLKHLTELAAKNEVTDIHEIVTATFLERLQMLAQKLDASGQTVATTHAKAQTSQSEIDSLLKSMGLS